MRLIGMRICFATLACASAALATGCASTGGTNASSGVRARAGSYSGVRVSQEQTRRGTGRQERFTTRFGTPRGREFEELIPVGARITAVHVAIKESINAIWLSYERNGQKLQTPRRGGVGGNVQTFKLGGREKIVDFHAYGQPTLQSIEIATNERVVVLGAPVPPDSNPWYREITDKQKRSNLGVGFIGRADETLRQLRLRIQIRGE